jgi:hypothetical protein
MVGIDSIKFDLTNCESVERNAERKGWMNSDGVAHLLTFRQGPIDWPFDLTDLEGARQFYGDQCASVGGVMLSMDVLDIDKVEVLQGLFKYRAPIPKSLAMMSVGILWIPFSNFRYQLNIEAMERGTTGMREAMVYAMGESRYPDPTLLQRCPWPEMKEAEPVPADSAEDMFDRMRASPLHKLPADDAQFDDMFPAHPLSLVRRRMKAVADTLQVDKMFWQSFKPYRLRH